MSLTSTFGGWYRTSMGYKRPGICKKESSQKFNFPPLLHFAIIGQKRLKYELVRPNNAGQEAEQKNDRQTETFTVFINGPSIKQVPQT